MGLRAKKIGAIFMEIQSFHEVVITPQRTLVLCDIDDTLLKWDKTLESCMAEAVSLFPNEQEYFQRINGYNLWTNYLDSVPPSWTDQEGFVNMLGRMSPCSRLVFLTARAGGEYAEWTKTNFECLGLNYNASGVFYTGNRMTKGEYIRRFIPLEGYEKVIFIDDLPENITSVSSTFPEIQCYQWINT